jgi:hypothetical protein
VRENGIVHVSVSQDMLKTLTKTSSATSDNAPSLVDRKDGKTKPPLPERKKTNPQTRSQSVITPINRPTTPSVVTMDVIEDWSCMDLCSWLSEMKISPETIEKFKEHEIDGGSFLHLTPDELLKDFQLKLGPAKKITLLIDKNGEGDLKEKTDLPPKRRVSIQEVVEIHRQQKFIKYEEIKIGNKIGSGAESTIFLGVYYGQDYAVKRMLKVKSKELDTILMLDDPCLMKCHYWSNDSIYCYYLMDLMDTTLDEALYEKTIQLSDREDKNHPRYCTRMSHHA